MLYGIGCDLCSLSHLEKSLSSAHAAAFVRRVYGPAEQAALGLLDASPAPLNAHRLASAAADFAAKEAFSKAIGLGIHWPMTWRHCEILNSASGQPHVVLHHDLAQWFAARQLQAHITLSDETDYAASFCVVEKLAD